MSPLRRAARSVPPDADSDLRIGFGGFHEELVELLHLECMGALSNDGCLFERSKVVSYVDEMSIGDEYLRFNPSLLSQLPDIPDAKLNHYRAEERHECGGRHWQPLGDNRAIGRKQRGETAQNDDPQCEKIPEILIELGGARIAISMRSKIAQSLHFDLDGVRWKHAFNRLLLDLPSCRQNYVDDSDNYPEGNHEPGDVAQRDVIENDVWKKLRLKNSIKAPSDIKNTEKTTTTIESIAAIFLYLPFSVIF